MRAGVDWLYKQIAILSISLSLLPVSEAPKVVPVAKKFPSYNPQFKTDEEKKEEVPETFTSTCRRKGVGYSDYLRVL